MTITHTKRRIQRMPRGEMYNNIRMCCKRSVFCVCVCVLSVTRQGADRFQLVSSGARDVTRACKGEPGQAGPGSLPAGRPVRHVWSGRRPGPAGHARKRTEPVAVRLAPRTIRSLRSNVRSAHQLQA